jgi:hypothetical protein
VRLTGTPPYEKQEIIMHFRHPVVMSTWYGQNIITGAFSSTAIFLNSTTMAGVMLTNSTPYCQSSL